jgi:Transposase DDE domain
MHCIKSNFDKIMQVLKGVLGEEFPVSGNLHRPGPKPKFTDIEVLALSITAECMGIDSELYLFGLLTSTYKNSFPNLLSRRQYNDRRKLLFQWQEKVRAVIAGILNEITEVYIMDSMPLEICKMSRMERNKLGKESEYSTPDKGYCASQDKWFYGYKLHVACSPSGVIQKADISRASIHDNNFLYDIADNFEDCLMIGDKGFIINPDDNKALLLKEKNICLEVPYRSNQKDKKYKPYVFKKLRKRVETTFSQLCDQFMMQRNYAKSYMGFRTRLLAKISGMTMLQYLNKFVNNRPVGKLKYALV